MGVSAQGPSAGSMTGLGNIATTWSEFTTMNIEQWGAVVERPVPRVWLRIDKGWFTAIVPTLEASVIIAVSIVAGLAYHIAIYGTPGPIGDFAAAGAVAAFWFTILFCLKSEYAVENFLSRARGPARVAELWTYAVMALVIVGFLTKTSEAMSRGWLVLFYFTGLSAIIAFDYAVHRYVHAAVQAGRVASRRVLLVGTSESIGAFLQGNRDTHIGVVVGAVATIPSAREALRLPRGSMRELLDDAVERGRRADVSDVIVLVSPQHGTYLGRIVEGLSDLPASIHLGGADFVDRFPAMRTERVGMLKTLTLVRPPLTFFETLSKRVVDIAAASIALVLVSPIWLIVTALIKLDSAGPVFFVQRRRGYNLKVFGIFKFRTMTTLDDGDNIVAASRGDARVTRVGYYLRKWNLDELPQLINVIRGEMSLVGPRPHALAHDVDLAKVLERYPRRLNVKPGITGWAQVNGWRGPMDTDEAKRERLAHDLYYVDNWSLAFDLQIMILTVLTRRAFKNAF